jgi:AbrB family looped-hinge helix DNA binding protein
MTTLVKIHRKGQMTLPSSFRTAMGVGEGSLVELSLKKGKTVITPKVVIDRSAFPSADDEYTPAQRRIIDARLDRSEEALKKGRGYGLFNTAEEMIADMKARMRKRSAVKKVTRPR